MCNILHRQVCFAMDGIIIFILLLIIAIQLVVIFFSSKKSKEKYKELEERCALYLDQLDRENQRLKTGKEPKKARKDYAKIIS
jgi:regulatory protein YycI of two-component signal transduction system YycFG